MYLIFLCCYRSVGVSNFGVEHLEGLRKAGRPAPSVNQIELHPLMRKPEVVNYCNEHGIVVMGYSPLAKGKKMDDTGLNEIAARLVIDTGLNEIAARLTYNHLIVYLVEF